MKNQQKPERYIVLHYHDCNGQREEAWASYNTKLDKVMKTSAYSQALHTAMRYSGEIFAEDPGTGDLVPVKTSRRA